MINFYINAVRACPTFSPCYRNDACKFGRLTSRSTVEYVAAFVRKRVPLRPVRLALVNFQNRWRQSRSLGFPAGTAFSCFQFASHAARKKLTRSRTKCGSSFRRLFGSSPARDRMSIGRRMRSINICAVERILSAPKRPLRRARRRMDCLLQKTGNSICSPSSRCLVYIAAQRRKSLRFGNCGAHESD